MTSSSGRPPSRSNSRRIVASGTRPRSSQRALELARLELRHEPDGPVEQPDEDEERRQPVAQRAELRVAGVRREGGRRLALLRFEDGDDRVALADLALRDDPPEPLPVVADREIGRAGRPAATDPPRLRDALDDPPRLRLGEREAGGPMAQPERLADLALGQRLLAGHEIGLDAGDRRRDAPRRAHLAPGLGELEADRLGDRAGARRGRAVPSAPPETCDLTVARFVLITCYVRVARSPGAQDVASASPAAACESDRPRVHRREIGRPGQAQPETRARSTATGSGIDRQELRRPSAGTASRVGSVGTCLSAPWRRPARSGSAARLAIAGGSVVMTPTRDAHRRRGARGSRPAQREPRRAPIRTAAAAEIRSARRADLPMGDAAKDQDLHDRRSSDSVISQPIPCDPTEAPTRMTGMYDPSIAHQPAADHARPAGDVDAGRAEQPGRRRRCSRS